MHWTGAPGFLPSASFSGMALLTYDFKGFQRILEFRDQLYWRRLLPSFFVFFFFLLGLSKRHVLLQHTHTHMLPYANTHICVYIQKYAIWREYWGPNFLLLCLMMEKLWQTGKTSPRPGLRNLPESGETNMRETSPLAIVKTAVSKR